MSAARERRRWCICSRATRNLGRSQPECFLHGDTVEAKAYQDGLADAALAAAAGAEEAGGLSEVWARALEDAADHFDKYDEVTIGDTDIGSNMVPVEPADRLRAMAEEIRARAPRDGSHDGGDGS